jgi:hypothetical protein
MVNTELKAQLRLSISAGLSSCFVFLLYEAIQEFATLDLHHQLRQLAVIALTSIGMLAVIEPLLERMQITDAGDSHRKGTGLLIRVSAFAIIAVTSLFHGLLHHLLGESLSAKGWAVIWELASMVIGPGVITFAWMRGLRTNPPKAKRFGLSAGIVVGIFLISASILQVYLLIPATASSPTEWVKISAVLSLAALFLWPILTTFAISGYLGGLSAERQWFGKPWEEIAIGLGIAGAVGAASEFLAVTFLSTFAKISVGVGPSFWSLLASSEIANAGWALGLLFHADFVAMFQPSPHVRGPDLRVAVLAVVAMFALGLLLSFGSLNLSLFLLKAALKRSAA